MSRILTTTIITLASLVAAGTTAFAHAQLRMAAVPSFRGAAAVAPEIRLKFSEGLKPSLSVVALATQDSVAEAFKPASLDPLDDSVLIIRVRQALKPGAYKVIWHAVSVDTHPTEGSFAFIVAP